MHTLRQCTRRRATIKTLSKTSPTRHLHCVRRTPPSVTTSQSNSAAIRARSVINVNELHLIRFPIQPSTLLHRQPSPGALRCRTIRMNTCCTENDEAEPSKYETLRPLIVPEDSIKPKHKTQYTRNRHRSIASLKLTQTHHILLIPLTQQLIELDRLHFLFTPTSQIFPSR